MQFRPPAVPLITHNPYLSVWSMADRLTDEPTKHWTGSAQPLCGLVRVDGQTYRCLGNEPANIPAMDQTALEVRPTQTIYRFQTDRIGLTLTFSSPLLPDDLEVLARPVTYLTWEVSTLDGRGHRVTLYFDVACALAVNDPAQPVIWTRARVAGLDVLATGSQEQPVLAKSGDNLRIDWGYLYLAVPHGDGVATSPGDGSRLRTAFCEQAVLPATDDLEMPRAAANRRTQRPVLACHLDLGIVTAPVSRHVLLAYDERYTVEYFGRKLRPYWRRTGLDAAGLLAQAEQGYATVLARCAAFDAELRTALEQAGGPGYAQLAALAFRQCLAAHTLAADLDGTLLMFSKENFSNGCLGTVDVTYPASPFFLLFNPALLRAQLTPILDYAALPRWPFPFAPHDVGQYPLANGQVYGGGETSDERQMPIEESGDMLLMVAALAAAEGNADYARKHWPLLRTWARYLRDNGLDPAEQLCTDDFAGHLAHNTNLSLKAILALGAYAQLCRRLGDTNEAGDYQHAAETMAQQWISMAADGDHYRLTFDRPGTWSQKYNLVWDRLLDLHLFPPEVTRKELAYYLRQQQRYGLPLDNRSAYTKLDWTVWSATLADDPATFAALVEPLTRWADETPSRVPLTDWYWTHDGKQRGFQARSVVGGLYVKLLATRGLAREMRG
jgi:hypothetical protein